MPTLAPRDLLLAARLSPDEARSILAPYGFRDPRRADENIQAMAEDPLARTQLAEIVDELLHCLGRSADPDQALVLVARLSAASLGRRELYQFLRQAPRTLDLMARVFGASPFMAEILIRDPGCLYWIADPAVLGHRRSKRRVQRELQAALDPFPSEERRRELLRVFKRREMLHIGVRDILRLASVEETLVSLSELAEVLIEAAYEISDDALRDDPATPVPATASAGTPVPTIASAGARSEPRPRRRSGYAVIGLGKLGGGELNFSSDVDLVYVYASDRGPSPRPALEKAEYFERLSRRVTAALGDPTNEGHVFRVDLRLRPEGRVGGLAHSIASLREYYASRGRTWERLALIKAWPVAGDRGLGRRFLRTVEPFVYGTPFGPEAFATVRGLRTQMAVTVERRGEGRTNVKLGIGGIREIEFVTQALQARFGGRLAAVRQRGTLAALAALREAGLMPSGEHDVLARAYLFLRDVENKLQMVSDAQVHALPADAVQLRALARTLGYPDGDGRDSVRDFQADHARHTGAVREVFTHVFEEGAASALGDGSGTEGVPDE